MSAELPHQDHQNPEQGRWLRDEEKEILMALLSRHPNFLQFSEEISSRKVHDMSDGGMGSVKFDTFDIRQFDMTLAEAEYVDSDGVLVLISVNIDTCGQLYEIDFWKTDFTPLKRYPQPSFLKIK